ncbi:MAG: nicotinate phosphoribosyltransferase [Candidatus Njordarchaeales archaeon]
MNSEERTFLFATHQEILSGKLTDIYFIRTLNILRNDGLENVNVAAEFTVSGWPRNYKWIVFGGLRDTLKLLEGKKVDVYALPEGTIFTPRDLNGIRLPVLVITGPYGEFVLLETPILGFLAAGSGFATKAARLRKIAGENVLIVNFGARRTHPAIAPFCDYYSYIGGFDAVSCVVGAELLGKNPTGTMPHSLLIIYKFVRGDHAEGWKAYDKYMPPEVPRIMLADTFSDEVEETLKAVEAIGLERIHGVRLDTPGSRKGNFADIVREVRWKLRMRGYDKVKIFLSGGIDEDIIPELLKAGADGFGIGSAVARAPFIDYAMDIVAIRREEKWHPISKRGKFDGIKQVWRYEENGRFHYIVTPKDAEPPRPDAEPLLIKFIENGKIIHRLPSPDETREYVLSQLRKVKLDKYPWEP